MPLPILADVEGLGVIIFLVVSFISWILNIKNQAEEKRKQKPQRQRQAKAGQGGGKLQSELDAFLKEVQGQQQQNPRPQAKPRPRPAPAATKSRDESRPKPRPRPQQRQAKPQKTRQTAERVQATNPPAPHRAELGAGLSDHVSEYMSNQISESVRDHIDTSDVRSELTTAHSVQEQQRTGSGNAIVSALRDPKSVRMAMVVNEILQRPKSLR